MLSRYLAETLFNNLIEDLKIATVSWNASTASNETVENWENLADCLILVEDENCPPMHLMKTGAPDCVYLGEVMPPAVYFGYRYDDELLHHFHAPDEIRRRLTVGALIQRFNAQGKCAVAAKFRAFLSHKRSSAQGIAGRFPLVFSILKF